MKQVRYKQKHFFIGGYLFSNLIFLIIVLLLINMAPEIGPHAWDISPEVGFLLGMLLYFGTLCLVVLQNYLFPRFLRQYRDRMLLIVNLELICFLSIYFFVLGSPRLFEKIPFLGGAAILSSLFSLCLYLVGIAVFHYSFFNIKPRTSAYMGTSRWSTVVLELRMLIPFVLPFLIFTFLVDLLSLYPNPALKKFLHDSQETPLGILVSLAATLALVFLLLVFLPPVIQRIWQCKALERSPLLERLQGVCEKAKFKHAGMKTWTVMNQSLTAAIIGILPRFRYVIFTKRLLHEMEPEWIEAILAHEIGHNYRRHLWIYPFIIFGMILCTGLYSLFFSETIINFFTRHSAAYPSQTWELLYPFTIFIPYALIIALYFRFVFGFFSRIFERQADLHVFHLGMDPKHMVAALNFIGDMTGNSHKVPSWHHYSIQERVDFLQGAMEDERLVAKHHNKVRWALAFYVLCITAAVLVLMSPLFSDIAPFNLIYKFVQQTSHTISNYINSFFPIGST